MLGRARCTLSLNSAVVALHMSCDAARITVQLLDCSRLPIVCLHNTPAAFVPPVNYIPAKEPEGKLACVLYWQPMLTCVWVRKSFCARRRHCVLSCRKQQSMRVSELSFAFDRSAAGERCGAKEADEEAAQKGGLAGYVHVAKEIRPPHFKGHVCRNWRATQEALQRISQHGGNTASEMFFRCKIHAFLFSIRSILFSAAVCVPLCVLCSLCVGVRGSHSHSIVESEMPRDDK